ncbi:MAG: extracellular solute-binding protein [Methanosaeta sp. PtaB.Bin039]|nr:MAG: extracellular solute-binding protein [Methanosaeta sp. PtaB.Bin039]OPY45950.1 MAG: extracellular solute-binding protein [Methanosaeta sp. PtaU1.Bin028]
MRSIASGRKFAFIFIIALTTFIPCFAYDQAASARNLTYITEQFPPYNFEEDGVLQGISVDVLERVWDIMGADLNSSIIEILPWSEGYQRALEQNDSLLFCTARSPEREELFKWAGPVGSLRFVLLAKTKENISITGPEELEALKIGAVEEDMAVQMLLDEGVRMEDISVEKTSEPIVDMLKNGSIDAWASNEITGLWEIQESGENASDYEAVYVLGDGHAYFAFNKAVQDTLVQSFQQAIDQVMSHEGDDGITDYQRIVAKYIPTS